MTLIGVQGSGLVWPAEMKSGWQVQWEKTFDAAKREKEVTVYGPSGIDYQNAMAEFQKRYPDIKLNYVAGSGSVHGPRIVMERRAGKYIVDLLVGGSTTPMAVLLPAQALDPVRPTFIVPEVADGSKWWRKRFLFVDPESERILMMEGQVSTGGMGYNTPLVSAEEVRSFQSQTGIGVRHNNHYNLDSGGGFLISPSLWLVVHESLLPACYTTLLSAAISVDRHFVRMMITKPTSRGWRYTVPSFVSESTPTA